MLYNGNEAQLCTKPLPSFALNGKGWKKETITSSAKTKKSSWGCLLIRKFISSSKLLQICTFCYL